MQKPDTQKLGTELRAALEAIGITPDRITVRIEPGVGQSWIRCIVTIAGQAIDVHTPADYWPPPASTARSLRWVILHGKDAVLNGTVDEWSAWFRRLVSDTPPTKGNIKKFTLDGLIT